MKGGETDMITKSDINPRKFGLRLILARNVARMSVIELAEKLREVGYRADGVTQKTVWCWEHGKLKEVTMGMIQCAARATGQEESYFLGLTPLDESIAHFRFGDVAGSDHILFDKDVWEGLLGDGGDGGS